VNQIAYEANHLIHREYMEWKRDYNISVLAREEEFL
jgi:hypothetical protein